MLLDVSALLSRVEDRTRELVLERALQNHREPGLDFGLATGRFGQTVMRASLGDLAAVVLGQLVTPDFRSPAPLDRSPACLVVVGPERAAEAWLRRNGDLAERAHVVAVRDFWDRERLKGLPPGRDTTVVLLPGADLSTPALARAVERVRCAGSQLFLTA